MLVSILNIVNMNLIDGVIYKNEPLSKEQKEENNKKLALSLMNETLMEKNRRNQKDYLAEAQYYLEISDWDLKKALDEYDADIKFEKGMQKKAGNTKKKR
jgi:hypothetical protein